MLEKHCPMYRDSKCVFTGGPCDLNCQMDDYDEEEFYNRKGESRVSEKKEFFWFKKSGRRVS